MPGKKRKGRRTPLAALLVDESPDALIALTLDGEVLSWNRAAEAMFGYPSAEVLGRPLDEVIIPAEHRAAARRFLEAAVASGSSLFETTRRRKDGELIAVDVTMRRVSPPGGEPFVAVSKKDVTQLHRLRTQQAMEAKFRGLLEAAPDAMVIVGADGRIQLVNGQAERLFGYRRDELLGEPIELLVPEPCRGRHADYRNGYLSAPGPRPMGAGLDLTGRRKDGTEFAAEISLGPITTAEGTLVTAVIRDVTDRRRDMDERNQRMQEASRVKSELLANMSHELRTPLNAIIGFTALLHAGKAGAISPTQKEYLGDILTSSRHLLQLINDVLDLAKVESGRIELHPEPVELTRLVREVREILRGLAAERRIVIEAELGEAPGRIVIDPRLFKQVLYNYLSNAIKFSREGGRVVLRVIRCGDQSFRLEVSDRGIGIKPQDMNRLFVEFQQLEAGASKRCAGSGLGLALTRRIVEAQGGQVGVESTPDEGSTFWAVLPCEVVAVRTAWQATARGVIIGDR